MNKTCKLVNEALNNAIINGDKEWLIETSVDEIVSDLMDRDSDLENATRIDIFKAVKSFKKTL